MSKKINEELDKDIIFIIIIFLITFISSCYVVYYEINTPKNPCNYLFKNGEFYASIFLEDIRLLFRADSVNITKIDTISYISSKNPIAECRIHFELCYETTLGGLYCNDSFYKDIEIAYDRWRDWYGED